MNLYPIVCTGPKTARDIVRTEYGDTWIKSTNPRYYHVDALRGAVHLFEGIPVHLKHAKVAVGKVNGVMRLDVIKHTSEARYYLDRAFEYPYRDLHLGEYDHIGHVEYPAWNDDTLEIRGWLAVESEAWRRQLAEMHRSGELYTWGFSPVWAGGVVSQHGINKFYDKLTKLNGLDLVPVGATGGRFVRIGG